MPLPPIVMRRMTPEIVGTSMLAQGNVSSLANKKGHRQVAFSYNRYLRFRRINRMRAAATTTAPMVRTMGNTPLRSASLTSGASTWLASSEESSMDSSGAEAELSGWDSDAGSETALEGWEDSAGAEDGAELSAG